MPQAEYDFWLGGGGGKGEGCGGGRGGVEAEGWDGGGWEQNACGVVLTLLVNIVINNSSGF